MNKRLQLAFCWCGPLAIALFFAAMVIFARFVPPPISPTTPVEELQQFYQHNQSSFLFGLILLCWGAVLLMPVCAVIAAQLRRMEGASHVASGLLLMASPLVAIGLVIPACIFAVLGFRPQWSPEITQMLSDLAWIMIIWPNPTTITMIMAVAAGILLSDGPSIYPRWIGFSNITMALMFFPSCFLVLFKSGPLAWNGILSFWFPAFDYGTWIALMTWASFRAVRQQEGGAADTQPGVVEQ